MFKEIILEEADGLFTFFVSANGYESFTGILKECEKRHLDYCWMCPKHSYEKVEVAAEIEKHVQFLSID